MVRSRTEDFERFECMLLPKFGLLEHVLTAGESNCCTSIWGRNLSRYISV